MPSKYMKKDVKKKYSENDFKLAMEAVTNGSSIRDASNTFHVPYTTLNSHVNNLHLYEQVGRPTKFSKEEEGCLEQAALALQVQNFFIFFLNKRFLYKELGCTIVNRRIFESCQTICFIS